MAADIREIGELLRGSQLGDRKLLGVPVAGHDEPALALEIAFDEMLEVWKVLRSAVDVTGRWPVATSVFGESSDWQRRVFEANLFARHSFAREVGRPEGSDVSVGAIVERAAGLDVDDYLRDRLAADPPIGDEWEYEIGDTKRAFGMWPSDDDIDRAEIDGKRPETRSEFQRWLYRWEIGAVGAERALAPVTPNHMDQWYDIGQPMALLLLPTTRGWEALAYLHWFAAGERGTEPLIALLRRWHERYGAELVAHQGTILEMVVSRPPTDPDQAFDLAVEQTLAAPCTTYLPGVSLRAHARVLRHVERWSLHERP